MKIEIEKEQARLIVAEQLKGYISDLNQVLFSLETEATIRAYNIYPYNSPVGANLEALASEYTQ